MRNGTERKKRRLGAMLSAVSAGAVLLVLSLCVLAESFGPAGNNAEMVAAVICAGLILCMVIGVAIALRQRLKEIEGGEEDEARKY